MKNSELAQKIKVLRNRKGYSQEELAEKTGLSLRTIQRIENGETEPRGDSLKRLAIAFDISPDEIIDWTVQEDKNFLIGLNLSALSFVVFPFFGILIPLILWVAKKDKIRYLNEIAKDLLNFQITWTIFLFVVYLILILNTVSKVIGFLNVSHIILLLFMVIMYLFNIVMIVVNAIRVSNEKKNSILPQSAIFEKLIFISQFPP